MTQAGRALGGMIAAIVGLSALLFAGAAEASSSQPFTDPNAIGYIGLCDLSGHNVSSGTLDSSPFVWKAVSSVQPPAAYQGKGQNAGLYIYQARQELPPGDWSGDELTSASYYSNRKAPTAVATYKDLSLKVITTEFPPMWNGLYELRMQFGKANYGIYPTSNYPATIIQVTGSTWHVVSGGLVNCGADAATSLETRTQVVPAVPPTPVKGLTPTTAPSADRASSDGPVSAVTPTASSHGGSSRRTSLERTVSAPLTSSVVLPKHHRTSRLLIAVLVVAALVVAGLIGSLIGRRRVAG